MQIDKSVIQSCKLTKTAFSKLLTTEGVTFTEYQNTLILLKLEQLYNELAKLNIDHRE